MSDATFHTTHDELRKPESRVSRQHHGKTPADSDVSLMKSIVDQNTNKAEQVEKTKSELPLPDQPPAASDWNSADQRTVNVGSGRLEEPVSGENNSALRDPATASSSARVDGDELHVPTAPLGSVGRQAKDGLDSLPKDATSR
ncbi:hypothetical protein PENDEC_c001G03333 [Penicillium decumbens]|uniref:Uncharacterized protein n=1 Tax=Penicillium decumbens TaxID=69771 RepID=A0A1V6PNJ4_PENDC|nr:hypothetical protein PENDEC_c001G03333 [Penicillium decumbens]